MTFEEILDQAVAMPQRRGRLTYRTLQRQFVFDEDALTDLKDKWLYTNPEIRNDAGRGIVWTGAPSIAPPVTSLTTLNTYAIAFRYPGSAATKSNAANALKAGREVCRIVRQLFDLHV
jgi:hypothetical protein